jgi:hypothetical protein
MIEPAVVRRGREPPDPPEAFNYDRARPSWSVVVLSPQTLPEAFNYDRARPSWSVVVVSPQTLPRPLIMIEPVRRGPSWS